MRNTKGFTLVELLAVIVILAVVMTMAVSMVGPLMARSRKGALGEEGLGLIEQAKQAYQLQQMKPSGAIKSTSTVCFSLAWLHNNGFFEKGSENGYTGSVLIKYNSGNYSYSFWISNGTYTFTNMSQQGYDYETATDGGPASETCGDQTSLVLCKADGASTGTCTAK